MNPGKFQKNQSKMTEYFVTQIYQHFDYVFSPYPLSRSRLNNPAIRLRAFLV